MDNDVEDKVLRIREENLNLKKQNNEANNNIKVLTTRLNRLMEMQKSNLNSDKTRKMVLLEDNLFNLQLKLHQLESENLRLRQRGLVLQTKLDAFRRRTYRSMHSSVPSRTDSGLDWNDPLSSPRNFNSGRPPTRFTVHRRSSSTISLNRVTFNSSSLEPTTSAYTYGANRVASLASIKSESRLNSSAKDKCHQKRASSCTHNASEAQLYRDGAKIGPHASILRQLKETQEEMDRLHEIVILQQQYIESINEMKGVGESSGEMLKSDDSSLKKLGSSEYEKMLEQFKSSTAPEDGKHDLDKNLAAQGIPKEVLSYVERLTSELVDSQIMIKDLRSKIIQSNANCIKMGELEQKVEHLAQENEILQKSLQNCIGDCISGLESNKDGDGSLDKSEESSDQISMSNSKIKDLQSKIKQLTAENVRQAQSLEEKNQMIDLLQVKYNNLKAAYDLISSSRLALGKPTFSGSRRGSKSEVGSTGVTDKEYSQLDEGQMVKAGNKVQSKETVHQKGTILDSLEHVHEMVSSVQSELETTLQLSNGYQDY